MIVCPIQNEVMVDPVVTSAGSTYERRAIEGWFRRCEAHRLPATDPMTNTPLASTVLTPNTLVRREALSYLEARGNDRRAQQAAPVGAAPPVPTATLAAAAPSPPEAVLPTPAGLPPDAVRQMAEMGFSEERIEFALQSADGNVESALTLLLD